MPFMHFLTKEKKFKDKLVLNILRFFNINLTFQNANFDFIKKYTPTHKQTSFVFQF